MLRARPHERSRMTRGRCGSLLLHRVTLSFTTPRRFNPAHGGRAMAGFSQFLTIDELKALSETDLEILRDAIRNEIINSPEIREILRAKARQVYAQLKPK